MTGFKRYGLGEFGLIIVGVFLALIAENSWSARGERHLTEAYLLDLHADLSRDTAIHRIWAGIAKRQAEAARVLLADLENPTTLLGPAETATALFWVSERLRLGIEFPTYDDLTASGNMRLLSREVRQAVVNYHMALDDLEADLALRPSPASGIGLLPGDLAQALLDCGRECGSASWTAPNSAFAQRAESVIATLGVRRTQALMEWRALPRIDRVLEETHRQSLWFATRLGRLVVQSHGPSLAAVAAAAQQ